MPLIKDVVYGLSELGRQEGILGRKPIETLPLLDSWFHNTLKKRRSAVSMKEKWFLIVKK